VYFQGEPLHSASDRVLAHLRRSRIGFVFQFFNLLPTLTAVENVALPLLLAGQSRRAAHKSAAMGLECVGLDARIEHFPEELSGGEMQRVAIARALISEPDAILCDEPTGNLDSASSEEILTLLYDLANDRSRAVVMVTHDPQAAQRGSRLVRIRDGLLAEPEA